MKSVKNLLLNRFMQIPVAAASFLCITTLLPLYPATAQAQTQTSSNLDTSEKVTTRLKEVLKELTETIGELTKTVAEWVSKNGLIC